MINGSEMLSGVCNINKPAGMTSRQVVNRIVRCCPKKTKVGHAGTLDPLATGVLLVAVGPATKLIQFGQEMPKTYLAKFRAGYTSDTEDATGNVIALKTAPSLHEQQLVAAMKNFRGEIRQTPPQFSAVKVNGQRAYKVARSGGRVEIKPRTITVHEIELLHFDDPEFTIEVRCSKGTYIRTLGRDIARHLGSDAIMTELTRTRIGTFGIEESHSLEQFDQDSIKRFIEPPAKLVSHLNSVTLSDSEIRNLAHGKLLDCSRWNAAARESSTLSAFTENGQLVAVLQKKSASSLGTVVNYAPQLFQGQ